MACTSEGCRPRALNGMGDSRKELLYPGGGSRTARGGLAAAPLPPQPEVLLAVVRHQHRPRAGVALEQPTHDLLLVGPGVGEDDVEVVGAQAELLRRTVGVGGEPREPVAGGEAGFAAARAEAA